MKKENTKKINIIRMIFAIIVIVLFIDFAIGGFLQGWINPK